jgi:HD-GYP domain-containing protein (c-di-GMP phosphodiesterase class II)
MRPISTTVPDQATTLVAPEGYLVIPLGFADLADDIGAAFMAVDQEVPQPPPASGVLVCLSHTPVQSLPPGWTGVWARDEAPPEGPWVPLPASAVHNPRALRRALEAAETWRRERLATGSLGDKRTAALEALNEIGIALSAERNLSRLLDLILTRARHLVAADAGSLYLVEKNDRGEQVLRFALAQNDSICAPWQESILPLNCRSVAGTVAQENTVMVIDDAYALPADGPMRHDDSFDRRFGYRTRSIVGIPLTTHSGDVLGVLQLINRKPCAGVPLAEPRTAAEVSPFSQADIELLRSLASQAAVSLENSRLYEDIQHLFESFVTAAVTTIEQRDPVTSGHSARVAAGTMALARRIERLTHGPWAGTRFSEQELRELQYAALLHDFGKVGVREKVLTKANKLYEEQWASIQQRFLLARTQHRAARFEAWLQATLQDPESMRRRLPQLYSELQQELASLDVMLRTIKAANEPSVVADRPEADLLEFRQWEFLNPRGLPCSLLTTTELESLCVRRGSLTGAERTEIESHVTHTYHFLRTIPWTRDLARIPELAYAHHEKLDGSGYPRGLMGADIPLGSRLMTIADIFDALTAGDRPYKRALPLAHALGILETETREGKLDASLVQLWIDSRAWEDISQ